MFKYNMSDKAFETEISLHQSHNLKATDNKSLKSDRNMQKKVDINVLKARAQDIQNKENRKNLLILFFLLIILIIVGIFLSI